MFEPRTTRPTAINKYYIRKPHGYSNCIEGKCDKTKKPDSQCDALPDNFAYIQGRFNEIVNKKKNVYFTKSFNIEKYFNDFEQGQLPKRGAVGVWKKNKLYYLALVETVPSDETICVSSSERCGDVFKFEVLSKSNKNWYNQTNNHLADFEFLFFLYHPEIDIPTQIKKREIKTDNTVEPTKKSRKKKQLTIEVETSEETNNISIEEEINE